VPSALGLNTSVFELEWGMGSVMVVHTAGVGIAVEVVPASKTRGT
jgi:hypothetical protein